MTSVADWSTTAASNTSVGGISTDGNVTLVNQIDNMFRGLMAEVATSRDDGTIDVKAAHVVRRQVFTSTGTYTPHAKMLWCEVEAYGGGGSGGGCIGTAAGSAALGSGGNSGAYAFARLTAADIGASKAVTIGAGGNGVTGGSQAGGNTSLGSLVVAKGGEGGVVSGASTVGFHTAIPSASQSTAGDFLGITHRGTPGMMFSGTISGGVGGEHSNLGGSGASGLFTSSSTGGQGSNGVANTGAGGGGSSVGTAGSAGRVGGAGGSGLLIVTEYCSS